jgi:hypothetical protein
MAFTPEPSVESQIEQWASESSKITSPDRLIAAGVVRGFATHFDDWKVVKGGDYKSVTSWERPREVQTVLKNEKKSLSINFSVRFRKGRSRDGDGNPPWHWHANGIGIVKVNGISIDDEAGQFIYRSWCRVEEEVQKARLIAATAKADAEINEAKWALAEDLLGYRREANGALVPKVQVK